MRAVRRALPLALACALAVPAFSAFALPGDETLLLDLCINDRCVGVAPVIARGDDVLIDREALVVSGIDTAGVVPERLGEREFISIRALNHGSTFKVDRTLLRLDLKLRADRLPRQTASLAVRPEGESGPQPWTAFVNYAATVGEHDDRNLFVDSAIGRGNAALRTTGQWLSNGGWQRGLSRFEVDQPAAMRKWTIGDQFATGRDPLAGGLLIGGVGVERAFDTDPYLVTFPRPYYSGVLESPGTVEVYANGSLVGRRDLDAGPFTLESLGIQPGRNDVRVIVRDPFGNRSELSTQTYYGGTPRLLARGLSEYAVRLGSPREDGGLGNAGYSNDATMQAWYRRGVNDVLTLGGRVEGNETLFNGGIDAAFSTLFGEFALAAAGSVADEQDSGHAWAANYSFGMDAWSVGLGTRRASSEYRALGDTTASIFGPLREDDYASLSFAASERLTFQLNAGRQRRELTSAERTAGITASLRVFERGQVFFSLYRRESDLFDDTTAQLNFSFALDRDFITVSAQRREVDDVARNGYGLDARRSRPTDTGFGYALNLQRDGDFDSHYAQAEYQGRYGRYAIEATKFDGSDTNVRGIASGAVVALGGRVFATPPLDSGFALVRVPGVADVPILRDNHLVGRTDANGDLLVRELLPFHANKVAFDTTKLPTGYDVIAPQRSVKVWRNTGTLVVLEASAVHAVKGHFRYPGAEPGDLVRVGDDDTAMPLGTDGLFYLDKLTAGRHDATVEGANGAVRCTIEVPAAAALGVTNLGDVQCEQAQ